MSASEEVAAVGDTQRFECQVVGYPSPNVTWYKDEVDITNNPRYNIHYDKDRGVIALTIRQVLPTDEGCYQCRAQNSEGYATTTAYLVVRVEHGLSRGFRSMLVSEKATEQETSQVQMASADKQRVFEEVITRVEETEKEVIEEKLFPPKLTYDRALGDGVQLKSGSTLYIEVGVSGIPFPDVSWHHGDAQLQEDARVTMETESGYAYLKLKGTTQEDAGVYKVTAENTVGKDEAAFDITVKAPPSPPRNLRVIEVYKDYITIAWDKSEHDNGFPITGYIIEKSLSGGMFVSVMQVLASEFEYKITRLYEGSEYMFRVMAENKIGVSQPATMEKPVKARLPFDPPGKPRGLAVTSVDKDAVGLRWEAPETDGGALITSYIVEKKDVSRTSSMWAIAGTVEGTKFEFLVPKLFTGNCYHFRVFAENRVGPGEPATLDDGVIAKLPYDKPMPARNIRAVETNVDYIVIEWDEPEHDGGSPITSYVIEKRDAKRREFIYIADVPGDVRTFKATRLFEGYEYYFRVFAENIVGASEPCEMGKAAKAKLPYDEPLEPHNLRVTDYWTDFVSLQWDAPTSDGGSPLTGYVIEKRDALRQTWVKAGNVGPDVDNFKVINLFEGTEYVFRVFAENKVGPSLKAAELDKSVRAKMPFDPPFAPQTLKTSDVNADRITVTWATPANDGGSPITRYVVEKRDAMRATWGACGYTEPGTCTLVVDGLIEGDNYFFRVAAENQVGRGEYVEFVHPITAKLPYSKPEKPVGLRTTEIWSTYIALAWDPPRDDGGSPVTGYNIEVRDTMKAGFKFVASVNASTTGFQVTNLEEGHEYYFRVFAENKAGLSNAAAELKPAVKAELPYSRPGAPSTIKVVGTGKATISITWTVPESDGGSPITGYIIEICPALSTEYSTAATVDVSTTSFTIIDLKEGADYFVRVRSQNAAGISKDATQTELPVCARAPKTAPSRPGAVSVKEVTTDSMTVTWKVPETDGGARITAYLVEIREVGATFAVPVTVDGKTLSATLTGLSPDKAYEVQVSAKNPAGTSEPIMVSEPAKTKPKPVEVKPEEVKPDEVKPVEVKAAEVKPEEIKPVEEKPVQAEPAVKPAETAAPAQVTLPSAPKSLRVTDAQPDAVTIAWEAPESDGGSPVTHYVVVIKDVASSKKYKKAGRVDCNTLSLRISDKIKKGHEYMIAVYAENAAGVSTDGAELATAVLVPEEKPAIVEEVVEVVEQAPVEAAKPKEAPKPTEPAAPSNPRLEQVTSESITITWDAPANDGGAEVSKYTICVRDAEKKKFKAAGTVDGKTTTYTIDKVKESHEYFIRVYAENDVGISIEGEVTTAIKVPTKKTEDVVDAAKAPAPEIVSAPEPVAVKEGETIRLTCKVKGDPEPEVEWYKDGTEVKPKRSNTRVKINWDMKADTYTLVINDATEADAGEYVIKAINSEGTKEHKVDVDVGETRVSRRRQDMSVTETLKVIEKTKKEADITRRVEGEGSASITAEISEKKKIPEEGPKPVEELVVEEVTPKVSKQPEAKGPSEEPTLEVAETGATMIIEPKVAEETKPSEPGPEIAPKKEPEAKTKTPSEQPTLEVADTEATMIIEPEVTVETKPSELGPEVTPKKEPEVKKPTDTEVSEVVETEIAKDVKSKMISETEISETEATITISTTEEVESTQPKEKITTTMTTEVVETAIAQVGSKIISETEVSEMEATITIDTTEEDEPSQPEKKIASPSVTEVVESQIAENVESKIISETEVSETEATITIDTTEEDEPKEKITTTVVTEEIEVTKEAEVKITTETEVNAEVSEVSEEAEFTVTIEADTTEEVKESEPEEKVASSVVIEEIDTEVTKEAEAKITTETEVNAEISEVSEEAEFTVTIEADTTEEVKESEPEEKVASSVVIEELETEMGKAPEATVSTEEETTMTFSIDTAASLTIGEDTIEEVTTSEVKTEKVAVAMKVESPSSSEDEETEDEKEPTATKAKEKVILADTEVTGKVSVTEETEATLTIEEVSEVSAESKSTETKLMTGVQKDVTQMTSGLQIVSIEGSEEESDEEEQPKVVGVQKDVTQITSGLQIVSIEGSDESSSEEEEEGAPPKFTQKPEPAVVNFGEEIRLVCKVTGDPEPEVTWFKGDKKLKQSKREPRLKIHWDMAQDLNILIITDAAADDAGEYTVLAENDHGSFRFTVTILVGKTEGMEITKTTESKRTTTVVEETTVDGEVVDRTVKQEVSEDTPEVTVEKTVVTEKPAEVVEVIQEEGAAPKFDKPPEPMLVDLGETIHLTCRVTGDPEPEVTWYKEGELIKPTKRDPRVKTHWDFKEDLNFLTIKDAVKEDEGKYTVIADNKFGSFKFSVTVLVGKPAGAEIIKTTESKRSVTVVEETIVDGKVVDRTVKEDVSESEPSTVVEKITVEESVPVESAPREEGKPPKFVQAPEPIFVDFGETVKLTCKVEGTPKPEVQWYKAKSKIETGDRSEVKYSSDDDIHMLIIIDATSDDAGEYTVIAENKFGSFKFTVTVLVGRPEGAEIVTKTIESKRSVKVIEETVVDGKVTQRVVQEDVSEDTPKEQVIKEEPILSHEAPSSEAVRLSTETIATEEVIVSKAAFGEDDVQTECVITLGEDFDSDKVHKVLEDTKVTEETSTTSEVFTIGAEESTKTILTQEATTLQTSSVTEATDIQNFLDDTVVIIEDKGEAPKFTQPPEPVFVDFRETVKLTCKVTGSPTPEVSWYRKGVPDKIVAKDDDRRVKPDFDEKQDLHILIIMDATAEDAGDYTVIAENKYGSFKFTVTVLVGRPEGAEIVTKTIESKRSVKVVEETVVDGKVVQRTVKEETSEDTPDSQTKVEETLILCEETPTDSTIEAASQMKVEECIIVSEDASEVHATIKDIEITTSDAVTIAATTSEVQKIEESVTSELKETQKAVESELAVKEVVTIEKAVKTEVKKKSAPKSEESSSEESSSEEESSEEELEKKPRKETGQAPKFSQPPEPVFVDVGETIKLTCKVTGDPEPKVTWHRGDDELSTAGRIAVDQTEGTHTLTITEATEEDAGDYKVRATNSFGTFNFTVTVLVGKPAGSRIVEMTRTTTSVRETIVDGEVVEHLEKEDVQTEKFDEIDSQSTTKVETSETTTLKQEVLEDVVTEEKTEKVEAMKPTGDKSPKIDIPPGPVSVDEGETIRLTCKVSGDPEPEVCWYKGQDVIKPKKRDTRIQANWDMSTDLNHLVVSEARPDDGGEYTMKAENEHGECSVTVIVKVGHQVEDKKQESVEEIVVEQVIEKGSVAVAEKEVTIEATTEKSEEVSAMIQLDAPEEEGSGAITKLSEVQEIKVGVIDTAEDSTTTTAESVMTESVTVKEMTETVTETEKTTEEESQPAGAPKMEIAPKPAIVDVGETVEVTCKFSGDPEPEVNFYKDDKLIKNKKSYKRVRVDWNMKTDIYTLIIESATAADAGDYVIKAENSLGLLQFTVSVVVGKAAETCVIETSRTVTVTEHTVVDGATTETVVHEETSTESSASGVTNVESTVTETVVQEVMDKPTDLEAKVPEITDSPTEDVAKVTEVAETVTEDVTKVTEVTERATKEVTDVTDIVETSTETVLKVDEKKEKAEEPMSEDSSEDSEVSESGEEDDGAPTVEEAPVPVSVKLGETICLKCKVTGDPEPEVSWLRNDVEVKPKRHDKRVKIDWDMKLNLHILTITNATLEDAGEYAVKAQNVNGGFTLKVTVVVSELTEQSTSVTKVETVEASESARVETGTSEEIKTSQSTIVETSKSTVVETTESEVEVSGKSQMSVGVDGAPVLAEAPEPAVVPVGGTVRLTCRVTGDPDPTLTWYKGHMPVGLDDSDRRIQTIFDTVTKVSTLSIQRASIIDGGKYAVHAENSKGLIIVTVDVVVSDEITELIVEDHTSERTVQDGSELVGITIQETSSRRKEGECELSVEEIIARELAGAHSTVSQLMTSQSSQSSLEAGASAPKFELPPEPVSVTEGATIRLTCKVTGHPIPTLTWLRDGQSLDGELWDKRMNIDFMTSSGMHVLAIRECRLSDAGIYTVMSQNNHGSTKHTVSVHVGEGDHSELVYDEGDDSALSFTRGKVTMKTTRFELLGDDDLHLNIGGDLSAAGLLKDIAGDRAVEGYRQERTGGPGAPVIKRPPQPVSVAVGKTIRLTCLASGDPEPDVTWYKAGKQIKPRRLDRRIRVDWDLKTDEQFLEIRKATEDDSGEYEMRAENSKGSTSFTVSVHVGDSGSAGATFERRVVQSSSSMSSSSTSSSSLLSDPMFSELTGSMRFGSKFK